MEILNIGPLELGIILILALIVLGPDGMVKTSRQVSRSIARIIRSPIWKELISTSEEIRSIPQKLAKEANLENSIQEISRLTRTPLITEITQPEDAPTEANLAEKSRKELDKSSDQ